jgi:hypothetical protein
MGPTQFNLLKTQRDILYIRNQEFSKWPASCKIILELVTGNVITSEVDFLTYAVISKAEKSAL